MATTKPVAKKKPNCIKGTACGFSCIAKGKQCSARILARDAKALEGAAKAKGKTKVVAKVTKAVMPVVTVPTPAVEDGDVKPFTSVKKLGTGAFGFTELTDRNTVVKTLSAYSADKSRDVSSLEKEYAGLKVLGDLGIGPKPIGIDKQKGLIEMEFISGTALVNLPEKLDTIGGQVEDTLFKLHKAGYTHNDMHAGNVMLTNSGEVKIIDAGMLTKAGSVDRMYTNGVYDLTRLLYYVKLPKTKTILAELTNNGTDSTYLSELENAYNLRKGDERNIKLAEANATRHSAYLKAMDKLGY